MKTNTKKLVLISLCLIAAGAVLTGIGMALGGRPGIAFSKNGITSPYTEREPYILKKTKIDPFSDVELKVGSYADMQILPSEDDEYYLEYQLDGNYGEPSWDVRKDTLTLRHTDRPYSDGIRCFFIGSFVTDISVRAYVTLYIPPDADMGKLDVYNDSGDVVIEGLAFGDTKLDVSYGDVTIQDTDFQDLELNMESGKCKAESLTAKNLVLKNEYGDVSLEDTVVEEAQLALESGTLKAENFTAESLAAAVDYGSVKLEGFSAETAEFTLESGDLDLDADALASLTCKSEYGNVKIRLPGKPADYFLDVHSEYGSIKLPEEAQGYQASFDNEAVYRSEGEAKGKIRIEVESGDIEIDSFDKK